MATDAALPVIAMPIGSVGACGTWSSPGCRGQMAHPDYPIVVRPRAEIAP